MEAADVDNKPVGQSTSSGHSTQANGNRTADAVPALGQPATAEPWEAAASSDTAAAAPPTAKAAALPSSQSAAPVTASVTLEQSRQSAASVAARAAEASSAAGHGNTLSAHSTAGLPLTPPSLGSAPVAEAAHSLEATRIPADTDTDRVSGQQPWPAAAPSSTSGIEAAAADYVKRTEDPQGGALDGAAPAPEPRAEPPTAEQAAGPEGQPGNGQDRALQATSSPVAGEEVGLECIARATSREQSLERSSAGARADTRCAVVLASILHERSRPGSIHSC